MLHHGESPNAALLARRQLHPLQHAGVAGAPETLTYAYQTQSNLLAISPNPNVISHSNITGAHAEHQLEQTFDGAARFMTAEQVAILYTQMSEHAQLLLQVFLMAKTRTCRKLAEPVIYEVCDTSRHLISELLTVRDYRMLQATEQQQRQTNAPMDKNAAPDILSLGVRFRSVQFLQV